MLQTTEIVLSNLADNLGIEIDNIHQMLNTWSLDASDDLPFYEDLIGEKPVQLWKRIATNLNWELIGQLGLRIVSITTSESNCERCISKQRRIAGDNGTNYSVETMKARLQVLSDFTELEI